MTLLVGLLTFVVLLAILVLVHELGHFTFAKLFGVRVEEFGLGFPPRVKSWRFGSTLYSINAIPLGGFVRMMGENGEQDEPDSFGAKPPWQRIIILAAGAITNVVLAVVIFFFLFMGGAPRGLTVVTTVAPHSPAAAAGLRPGDRITAIDGRQVKYFDDLYSLIQKHLGQRVVLNVARHRRAFHTSLVPRRHAPSGQGAMGVGMGESAIVSYAPGPALHQAVGEVGVMVGTIPAVLDQLFHHGAQGLQGPIGIAHDTTQVVGNSRHQGPSGIFFFAAFLSANLGVVNLLPMPALDGGRIVFVVISWIRRRNLDPQVEGLIHVIGMAVLLAFILLVSYHDVVQWISGQPF